MTNNPSEYPVLSSYLTVHDGAQAIAFYQAAFGATERFRLIDPATGKVGHAELMILDNLVMLSDEYPEWGRLSPKTLGGTPVSFCLAVDDTDNAMECAVAAGATVKMSASDQFYGFRSGTVTDPFGHEWMIQHEIEKVSPQEMQRRWDAMGGECNGRDPA
jgi:PhnB protein